MKFCHKLIGFFHQILLYNCHLIGRNSVYFWGTQKPRPFNINKLSLNLKKLYFVLYVLFLIAKPESQDAMKHFMCTNTINCPFFNSENIEMNRYVKKKCLDDLNDSNQDRTMEKAKARGELKCRFYIPDLSKKNGLRCISLTSLT